ncbi:hypothetical protein [Niveibacterium sp.]|uniref:hypothetical protein n=1 Tax=Niveibacterium sp. TaxID=2017444 RepID=UPI0035B3E9C8
MDILGYKDLMVASSKVGNEQEVLEKLHGALERARELLKPTEAISLSDTPPKDRFSLKAFTDNIVVGWPVKSDAESEFGDAFSRLAEFQLQMAIDGYFIRGGLSVGPAYVDEIAVFGGALLEAYDGESTLARDPRVVLTQISRRGDSSAPELLQSRNCASYSTHSQGL